VAAIILKKTRSLLKDLEASTCEPLRSLADQALLLDESCDATPAIADGSVRLVVTSPPFLNIVAYETDNWLRCWFNQIDAKAVKLWQFQNPDQWQARMSEVFRELHRILVPGGHVAFEVGEVSSGKIKLEERVIPAALEAELEPLLVLINDQNFTKTSNCWGISNQTQGTNTNRVVLLRKSDSA
jgi:DNA modification methylase